MIILSAIRMAKAISVPRVCILLLCPTLKRGNDLHAPYRKHEARCYRRRDAGNQ